MAGQRWGVCGQRMWGRVGVVPGTDLSFCAHHPFCQICAEPHLSADQCPAATGGVRLEPEARRLVDAVVATLDDVGVHLPHGVPVHLVPSLPSGQLGATMQSAMRDGSPVAAPSVIHVRVGLDETLFGAVVAHELTHAWMHAAHIAPADAETAEGICELVAVI